MSRPVVHTKFGNLAVTRIKLVFSETMLADPKLKQREQRVGSVLLSTYRAEKGYGETSMEWIADVLGIDKGAVSRAVDGLERAGYFRIERAAYRHGVKGKTNRYFPCWDKVTSEQPFDEAARANKVVKMTTLDGGADANLKCALGCPDTPKWVVPETTNPDSLTLTNPAEITAPRPAGDGADGHAPVGFEGLSDQEVMGLLEQLQRWLRERPDRDLTAEETDLVGPLRDDCYSLWECRDHGDPIGGMAQRLATELDALLPDQGLRDYVAEHDRKIAEKQLGTIDAELKEASQTTDANPSQTADGLPTDDVVVALDPWPTGQKKFGPWLAARRNQLGVQVRDLADAIGIKASDLFDIETGRVGLGIAMQRKAVAYLKERAA